LVPRWKQQLGSLFIALLGAFFIAWDWHAVLYEGHSHYPRASMIFPGFCVLGLALNVFPEYKEERIARGEDISGLCGGRLLTPRWWAILILALVAGVVNQALVSSKAL
jgi:drug/metabolite transporter (DMT)-like permease